MLINLSQECSGGNGGAGAAVCGDRERKTCGHEEPHQKGMQLLYKRDYGNSERAREDFSVFSL